MQVYKSCGGKSLGNRSHYLGGAVQDLPPAFKHARVLYLISFHHNSEFSSVNRSWLTPGLLLSYCPHLSTELYFFITEILNQDIKSHCLPDTEIYCL